MKRYFRPALADFVLIERMQLTNDSGKQKVIWLLETVNKLSMDDSGIFQQEALSLRS